MDQPTREPATVEALKARRKALETGLVAALAKLATNPSADISRQEWKPSPALQKITAATRCWFMAAYHKGALKPVLLWGLIALGISFLIIIVSSYLDVEWTWKYWGEHKVVANDTIETTEIVFDRSAIFRNLGLAALAVIGVVLATWRSTLAYNAHKLSERNLIFDRYQRGASMLASEKLAVRIAGVFALRELALSNPKETYILVLDVLYAFVREESKGRPSSTPSEQEKDAETYATKYSRFTADLAEALNAVNHLRNTTVGANNLESNKVWQPDLRWANLSSTDLSDNNLSGAKLWNTNLSDSILSDTNLSGAGLWQTDLSGAKLFRTNLSGATIGRIISDHKTELTSIWAFEDDPPIDFLDDFPGVVAYRRRNEDWDDFQARIRLGWPEPIPK